VGVGVGVGVVVCPGWTWPFELLAAGNAIAAAPFWTVTPTKVATANNKMATGKRVRLILLMSMRSPPGGKWARGTCAYVMPLATDCSISKNLKL